MSAKTRQRPAALPPRKRYSPDELQSAWHDDQRRDAEHAEAQAANGPYYPEKGITRESLLAYAAECRAAMAQPIPRQFARQNF